MGERKSYSDRRKSAVEKAEDEMSLISAQTHTKLPYQSSLKDFPDKLPQHLLGILVHGSHFTIYRTFENVQHGGNLAAYCFLSELEK